MKEKMGLGKEMVNIGAGLVAIEAGPALVKSAFKKFGPEAQFFPEEMDRLNEVFEGGIDFAQGVAVPVAAIMVAYAGLKHMFKHAKSSRA